MTMIAVAFEREHGSGLQFSNVYINGKRLRFVNHQASDQLEPGQEFEIYWRIAGSPGSSFTLKYTAAGVTKTPVDKDKIAVNKSKKTNFTFVTL
ncbi:hypothetical protein [Allosphingosinicella sp.]|uniref:hypothetical protein n=1 Tax=Allosphingosinicella sp. TaxID=2823234 RepID=UPI002F06CA08